MVEQEPGCSIYFQQVDSELAFLSVTPESLFCRNKSKLEIDVIAGTVNQGTTQSESALLAKKLKQSKKDKFEHNTVLDYVKDCIRPFCKTLKEINNESLLQLSKVQHLKTTILGTVQNSVGDLDLLSVLHPTPATGGVPVQVSLNMISSLESFNRGWYSGAVGLLGVDMTEFFVGIRSCLIHTNKIQLFVGAGIVSGSEPAKEWEELNFKIENYLSILRV